MFRRLDHFADIHYGKSPSPVINTDGAIPVYGTGGVYARASKPLFPGPAVIVPSKGSLGSPHIAAGPFWASDTTYAVIPKSGVDTHWLYYQLCHFELEKLNEATGVPSISRDWLSKIDIADQDEPTQTAAAARIRCLEEQITHTEAQIAKQEQLRAGLMQDLFPRGVDDTGRLRPPREVAPELYQETALGWLPRGWEPTSLKTLVPRAVYGSSDALSDDANGVPVLRMNNIQDGRFDVSNLRFAGGRAPVPDLLLKRDDILFNRTNSMEHVGKAALWREELPSASFASYLVRLDYDRRLIRPEYLLYWLNLPATQTEMRRYATPGVHQVNINPTSLRRLVCAHPTDVDEQARIVNSVAALDTAIDADRAFAAKLRSQRTALLRDLLTPPAAAAAELRIAAE